MSILFEMIVIGQLVVNSLTELYVKSKAESFDGQLTQTAFQTLSALSLLLHNQCFNRMRAAGDFRRFATYP